MGVGAAFGVSALSSWSAAKKDCGTGCPEGSTARGEKSSAQTAATASTVAFAAGGAGIVAGVILLLTSRSSSPPTAAWRFAPLLGAKQGGLAAEGIW